MLVKSESDELVPYLTDASNMPGGHAEKLLVPENEAEIAEILREANEKRIPVTISGARTGTVGGAVPFGGWVISLEKLNKIKSIDKDNLRAVVEPGVILADFEKAVEAEGLFYPPDPTEWSCQIGGTVATNASGSRSFKYGATREFVVGIRVVLPNGEALALRRGQPAGSLGALKIPTYKRPDVRKNVSGFFNDQPLDAIDLFIGSEGTLAVITEIELSVLPKPEGFFSGIIFFPKNEDLLAFVDAVKQSSFGSRTCRQDAAVRVDASLIEYFDERALAFIEEKFPETPPGMAGAIFFEQETTSENEDALLEAWNEL
ncbi:MAG: FAD-binding oxidoreductase, partial [bacterium]|nr:FAD-binding oxidoreductase [bacterium]